MPRSPSLRVTCRREFLPSSPVGPSSLLRFFSPLPGVFLDSTAPKILAHRWWSSKARYGRICARRADPIREQFHLGGMTPHPDRSVLWRGGGVPQHASSTNDGNRRAFMRVRCDTDRCRASVLVAESSRYPEARLGVGSSIRHTQT